jgi:hypothetical protein
MESPETTNRMAQALALLDRTGYGRGGFRSMEPNEYGQARSSSAAIGTSAAGLSGQRRLLAAVPWIREKMLSMETNALADALADKSGKKLMTMLNYNPNDEMARNLLLTLGIGYGLENKPTGE